MEELLKLPHKLQRLAMRTTLAASKSTHVPAPRRVFAVAELLVQILLHIDLWTLFQAQRINRQFHRIVLSTPSLRHKLWLEPPNVANADMPVVINPMIQAHLRQCGIVDIESSTYTIFDLPIVRTTFEHRSHLATLQLGPWHDLILVDFLNIKDVDCMAIWHRTVPEQRHSERIAGLVTNVPHVRLGECTDALLSMRIGAEGFDFQDRLVESRTREHKC